MRLDTTKLTLEGRQPAGEKLRIRFAKHPDGDWVPVAVRDSDGAAFLFTEKRVSRPEHVAYGALAEDRLFDIEDGKDPEAGDWMARVARELGA
jgi:hypothetical protein